jgi:hypothetical protein
MYDELMTRAAGEGIEVAMFTDGRVVDVVVTNGGERIAEARGITDGRLALETFEHPFSMIPGAAAPELLGSHDPCGAGALNVDMINAYVGRHDDPRDR